MKIRPWKSLLIDGLFLPVAALAGATAYEAEDQPQATGAVVHDSAGVSGGKYVNANGMTFSVTVDTTGIYDLALKMWVKRYDWFNSARVKNLIWTWNIERDPTIGYDAAALNPAWYPGDAYVDVIGVDIYNSSGDQKSNINEFSKIVSVMGTKKLMALTENGPIPDVDSMATDGAVWSWWMPWYNTWSSGFLNQTPNTVWAKNLGDARILSLSRMPGWDKYSTGIASKGTAAATAVRMTVQDGILRVRLPAGQAMVSIHDLQGHRISSSLCRTPGSAPSRRASPGILPGAHPPPTI